MFEPILGGVYGPQELCVLLRRRNSWPASLRSRLEAIVTQLVIATEPALDLPGLNCHTRMPLYLCR